MLALRTVSLVASVLLASAAAAEAPHERFVLARRDGVPFVPRDLSALDSYDQEAIDRLVDLLNTSDSQSSVRVGSLAGVLKLLTNLLGGSSSSSVTSQPVTSASRSTIPAPAATETPPVLAVTVLGTGLNNTVTTLMTVVDALPTILSRPAAPSSSSEVASEVAVVVSEVSSIVARPSSSTPAPTASSARKTSTFSIDYSSLFSSLATRKHPLTVQGLTVNSFKPTAIEASSASAPSTATARSSSLTSRD